VHAVEHAEVVALAPDDLLAAGAERERNGAELDVGVGLAQLVVELEDVALAVAERADREVLLRENRPAAGRVRDADLVGVVEEADELPGLEAGIGLPVRVLLLEEARDRKSTRLNSSHVSI